MHTRPIGDRERQCLLCARVYQAKSYTTRAGFCPICWTPERRREQQHVFAATSRAKSANLLVTLTVLEWLAILDHFHWKCAYCGGPYEIMEHVQSTTQGGVTTKDNVVSGCITCNSYKDRANVYPSRAISAERIEWVKSELARIQHRPQVEPTIDPTPIFVELRALGLSIDSEEVKLRVKEVALQQGIRKTRLQRESGVPMLTLDRYWFRRVETENIHMPTIERIARALGVKVADLFEDNQPVVPQKEKVQA